MKIDCPVTSLRQPSSKFNNKNRGFNKGREYFSPNHPELVHVYKKPCITNNEKFYIGFNFSINLFYIHILSE